MKPRFSQRATQQVDAILGGLADRSPQGATRVAERIQQIAALLSEHPLIGRKTARPSIRRIALVPYPYVIDYRVDGDTVVIVRLRHTSRWPIP